MSYTQKNLIFFLVVVIIGIIKLWPAGIYNGHTDFAIQLITYLNFVLLVTSLVCIKEFFIRGEDNRTPFHVFNGIFIILFYTISLTFLVVHRDYYEGYSHLGAIDAIEKFSMRWDIFSVMFWIILFALGINITYIVRNRESYLQYS